MIILYSYAEIIAAPSILDHNFDAIACNFSLLEEEILELLKALRGCLASDDRLVIQTVHPWNEISKGTYQDSWRTEIFTGFDQNFTEAMPWYFRTLSSWFKILAEGGYLLHEVLEPVHPNTGKPLSLLLVAALG